MKTRSWLVLVILAVVVALCSAGIAHKSHTKTDPAKNDVSKTSAPDNSIEKILKETNLKYGVGDAGDYVVVYSKNPGESIHVWINSETSKIGSLEFREIWSVAYRTNKKLPAEITKDLLKWNGLVKIGSCSIREKEGVTVVMFSVRIDTSNLNATQLGEVINQVAICTSTVAAITQNGRRASTRINSTTL